MRRAYAWNQEPFHPPVVQGLPGLEERERGRSGMIDRIADIHPSIRGDVALWRAVISQALADAKSSNPIMCPPSSKREALHWLTKFNKDFMAVCLHAELDPQETHKCIIQTLEGIANAG